MKVSVIWETDGKKVNLPQFVDIPQETIYEHIEDRYDPAIITDYLSDVYGWLVYGWEFVYDKCGYDMKEWVTGYKCRNKKCEFSIEKIGWNKKEE